MIDLNNLALGIGNVTIALIGLCLMLATLGFFGERLFSSPIFKNHKILAVMIAWLITLLILGFLFQFVFHE